MAIGAPSIPPGVKKAIDDALKELAERLKKSKQPTPDPGKDPQPKEQPQPQKQKPGAPAKTKTGKDQDNEYPCDRVLKACDAMEAVEIVLLKKPPKGQSDKEAARAKSGQIQRAILDFLDPLGGFGTGDDPQEQVEKIWEQMEKLLLTQANTRRTQDGKHRTRKR